MRCLETERNSRLQQKTQLSSDFVKGDPKEQEDRMVDIAKHRSEMSRVMCEWQAFKSTGGLNVHRYTSASTPTGSNSQNYLSLSFAKSI